MITSLLVLVICLSASCVFANDNSTDTNNEDFQEYIPVENDTDLDLEMIDIGNYTELNQEISNSTEDLNLTKDYSYVEGDDYVQISRSITIIGNNHTIDNGNSSFIIDGSVSDLVLTFENITLKNFKLEFINNETDVHNQTFMFFNCTLMPDGFVYGYVHGYYDDNSTSGNISKIVKLVAPLIVGSTTGIDAVKKIAEWISKNTIYESGEGFYQPPEQTLMKLRGNCCSLTDLFFHMCDAVGLTNEFKFSYVHVGTLEFKKRHFFAMVDDLIVDVTLDDPWGHASIGERSIYNITPYPYLPLPRQY